MIYCELYAIGSMAERHGKKPGVVGSAKSKLTEDQSIEIMHLFYSGISGAGIQLSWEGQAIFLSVWLINQNRVVPTFHGGFYIGVVKKIFTERQEGTIMDNPDIKYPN